MRIEGRSRERPIDMVARLVKRRQRGIERLHGRIDKAGRLGGAPLQPAHCGRQRRHRRAAARHDGLGLAQILGDLFGLHHAGAAFRQRGFLARLGRKLRQLVSRMAQPVGLALGTLHLGAVARDLLLGIAADCPQPGDLGGFGLQAPIGVQQQPVGGGIDKGAVVMLAVDFDQRAADAAQHLDRHRLVVEEGAGAAVGKLDPAKDQFLVGRNVVRLEDGPRRVTCRHVERGSHLALLGALAHETRIATRTKRKCKGIEQDRFSGASLAGQHRQAGGKIDIEAINQDDVADREPDQHGVPVLSPSAPICPRRCF